MEDPTSISQKYQEFWKNVYYVYGISVDGWVGLEQKLFTNVYEVGGWVFGKIDVYVNYEQPLRN